jgi:hypothetical protein
LRSQSDHWNGARSVDGLKKVTITMRVHPFRGRPLRLVRVVGGTQLSPGVQHLDLVDPKGKIVRVPAAWTDFALPDEAVMGSEAAGRLNVLVLIRLAGLIEAIEHRKLDEEGDSASLSVTERVSRAGNEEPQAARGGDFMDGTLRRATGLRARNLGRGSSAAPAGRGQSGGKRGSR